MLIITVRLLNGRYDAANPRDPTEVEWPPHPARMFCALLATVKSDEERGALEWLEQQPPPNVHASDLLGVTRSVAYVVTNKREKEGGSQIHAARTNQLRVRVAGQLASANVRFEWSAHPGRAVLTTLRELANRVPYLGRSTGIALVDVMENLPEPALNRIYRPADLAVADVQLRVPYSGYLRALEISHETGRPAWEVGRSRGYAADRLLVEAAPSVRGPFRELVPLRFVDTRPEGGLAPRFTQALRSAVMSRVGDPLPDQLHGHGADDRPHVAFVALPNVGNSSANGQLLALGVALPDMPSADRRSVLRGIIDQTSDDGGWTLQIGGRAIRLVWDPSSDRPSGATAQRWTASSQTWSSVTPVALDRHPKRAGDVAAILARSCLQAGYPEPIEVRVSSWPLLQGVCRPTAQELPAWLGHRTLRHVQLRFAERVQGPVLVGAGRYLGIGLFAPVDNLGNES